MALAAFKDLCIDANDVSVMSAFWAGALALRHKTKDDGDAVLVGPSDGHTVWVNAVPEPKGVKNRVHLDVLTAATAELEALGARVLRPEGDDLRWSVMADPEGNELCAFVRPAVAADRLHALVVDSSDPTSLATWWAEVYGAGVVHHPQGYSSVVGVAGMPAGSMDFVPVPEPKTVKNRVHWDVTLPALGPLLDAGARLLRPVDDEIAWYVLADPEGNEFCAFLRSAVPAQ